MPRCALAAGPDDMSLSGHFASGIRSRNEKGLPFEELFGTWCREEQGSLFGHTMLRLSPARYVDLRRLRMSGYQDFHVIMNAMLGCLTLRKILTWSID